MEPAEFLVLVVAYIGDGYVGFQRQPGWPTIEGELETALYKLGTILEPDVSSHSCGGKVQWARAARTDRGVSASGNVISCRMMVNKVVDPGSDAGGLMDRKVQLDLLKARINAVLPSNIRVIGVIGGINEEFDARRSCKGRRYEYLLPLWALDPKIGLPRSARADVNMGSSSQLLIVNNDDGMVGSEGLEAHTAGSAAGGEVGYKAADEEEKEGGGKIGKGRGRWELRRQFRKERRKRAREAGKEGGNGHECLSEGAVTGSSPQVWIPGESARKATASAIAEAAASTYDLSEERLSYLNSILAMFEGTHSFHNFTNQVVPAGGLEAKRDIERFFCDGVVEIHPAAPKKGPDGPSTGILLSETEPGGEPSLPDSRTSAAVCGANKPAAHQLPPPMVPVRYARLVVLGRSFMMHQIRKMVGLFLSVARGTAGREAILSSLSADNPSIKTPMAPGTGLLMDRALYDFDLDGDRGFLMEASRSFKEKVIYPAVASTDPAETWLFLKGLNDNAFGFSKWPKATHIAMQPSELPVLTHQNFQDSLL